MKKPSQEMTVTLAVHMPSEDLRDVLQNLVDAVAEDVFEMTDRVRKAVERAQSRLGGEVQ
jgi:hypothetical protein